jgi:hypothetical protein
MLSRKHIIIASIQFYELLFKINYKNINGKAFLCCSQFFLCLSLRTELSILYAFDTIHQYSFKSYYLKKGTNKLKIGKCEHIKGFYVNNAEFLKISIINNNKSIVFNITKISKNVSYLSIFNRKHYNFNTQFDIKLHNNNIDEQYLLINSSYEQKIDITIVYENFFITHDGICGKKYNLPNTNINEICISEDKEFNTNEKSFERIIRNKYIKNLFDLYIKYCGVGFSKIITYRHSMKYNTQYYKKINYDKNIKCYGVDFFKKTIYDFMKNGLNYHDYCDKHHFRYNEKIKNIMYKRIIKTKTYFIMSATSNKSNNNISRFFKINCGLINFIGKKICNYIF